jgi:deleted-in-malignant-brain-tumors protein 1
VCDDSFDAVSAKVACRQLGFETAFSAASYSTFNANGPASLPTWLDDVTCTGSEAVLGDCPHRGWGVEVRSNCI